MGMLVMGMRMMVVMVVMLQGRIRNHGVESRGFGDEFANYSCHVIVSQVSWTGGGTPSAAAIKRVERSGR